MEKNKVLSIDEHYRQKLLDIISELEELKVSLEEEFEKNQYYNYKLSDNHLVSIIKSGSKFIEIIEVENAGLKRLPETDIEAIQLINLLNNFLNYVGDINFDVFASNGYEKLKDVYCQLSNNWFLGLPPYLKIFNLIIEIKNDI